MIAPEGQKIGPAGARNREKATAKIRKTRIIGFFTRSKNYVTYAIKDILLINIQIDIFIKRFSEFI